MSWCPDICQEIFSTFKPEHHEKGKASTTDSTPSSTSQQYTQDHLLFQQRDQGNRFQTQLISRIRFVAFIREKRLGNLKKWEAAITVQVVHTHASNMHSPIASSGLHTCKHCSTVWLQHQLSSTHKQEMNQLLQHEENSLPIWCSRCHMCYKP